MEGVAFRTPEAMRAMMTASRRTVPASLAEALDHLEADDVIKSALGEHIYDRFMTAKRIEWDEYRQQVHQWELDQYLGVF